jgi:hypothetical protein
MARPPKPKTPKVDRLVERDGALWQKCQNRCPRTCCIEAFAPRTGEATLAKFRRAVAEYKATRSATARATIVQLVVKGCDVCRDSNEWSKVNPTTKRGQCKAYWEELKATTFHTCVDCGGTRCAEADNVVSDADRAVLFAEGKVLHATHHQLSGYSWWACHGGVEGMQLEQEVCRPRCKMCHALQPTSYAGKRVDPSTLPPPVEHESRVDPKLYHKRYNAKKSWPRYAYVDELKRAVGRCENRECRRDGPGNGKCVAGVEQAFDWEHTNAKRKRKSISNLCAHLPANMPEAKWKEAINDELKRGDCKLLCKNCHHLKTWHGMVPRYRVLPTPRRAKRCEPRARSPGNTEQASTHGATAR